VVDVRPEHEELLRRLALNDEASAEATVGALLHDGSATHLDARTFALVRVAALIAAESAQASHSLAVDAALAAGASDDLGDTVDYAAVSEAIARVVSSERYHLIERLATRIGEVCSASSPRFRHRN
jgi:hypothetical protein